MVPNHVTYPQNVVNCATCHATEAAQTLVFTRPSVYACTSCHDDLVFSDQTAPVGGVKHTMDLPSTANCAMCHHEADLRARHTDTAQVEAAKFSAQILGVTSTAPGEKPVVKFVITNPLDGNKPWKLTDAPFTQPGGASTLAVLIGWSNSDFQNAGAGANFGQPVNINLLAPAGGAVLAGPDEADGSYTITSGVAVPAGAEGSGTAVLQGHPGFMPEGATVALRLPMKNVSYAFAITDAAPVARRTTVSIDKCNACHQNLSLHGNNRTGDVTTCLVCHNTEATDGSRRPNAKAPGALGTDGKLEEGIDFKYMIHSIHSKRSMNADGITVYGYGGTSYDFGHATYPQVAANCQACHEPGKYQQPGASANGTTTYAGGELMPGADNLRTTKYLATCGACHASATGKEHIKTNGGATGATQAEIDAVNYVR
jgi:OmcA/MtrC family decaheme c-type cytochrome